MTLFSNLSIESGVNSTVKLSSTVSSTKASEFSKFIKLVSNFSSREEIFSIILPSSNSFISY
ncbi:MAG: hypothetical protein C0433_12395 [Cyclobacterium sp.]|nr:hypothetical protein [Cyclobacterium sp.]